MKNFILVGLFLITFISNINAQIYNSEFSNGYDGWSGDFADYPTSDSILFQLEFNRTTLPEYLDAGKYCLKISGNNHSDDLFMFIKRKISGLKANSIYKLRIDVEFASNAPTNTMGVGGAQGEGVIMKAGAMLTEPLKIDNKGFYEMNISKGNQVTPGTDIDTIGHIGVSDTTTVFTIINRTNATHVFTIKTNEKGEVWVCIGTDSGYESVTTLYYTLITLNFLVVSDVYDDSNTEKINIYPNPATNNLTINISPVLLGSNYLITDLTGKAVLKGTFYSEIANIKVDFLPAGMYLLQVGKQNPKIYKFLKIRN